jgi:LysM repeat protein
MDKSLKPGSTGGPKIKFNARRALALVVLSIWVLSILACTKSVDIANSSTATVWASRLTAVAQIPDANSQRTENTNFAPVSINPSVRPTETQTLQPSSTLNTPEPTPAAITATVQPTHESAVSIIATQSFPTNSAPGSEATFTSDPSHPTVLYYTQAGDTLPALAVRFSVEPSEITSPQPFPKEGLITPNQLLLIPSQVKDQGPSGNLMPDSEVVFSPSATDFDIDKFVNDAGGYLSTYRQYLSTGGWHTGAQVIERVAIENSVNPRILLSILEYQSHWVYGQPRNLSEDDYPLGYQNYAHRGLYRQLSWAVSQLSLGYYGWREGLFTDITFIDKTSLRMAPELNAGTVAIQYLFAKLYNQRDWGGVLYNTDSMPALHSKMFGDSWLRAQTVEPLYPPNLTQPDLVVPWSVDHVWAFTGGPHSAWGPDGARAALDFAPSSAESGCVPSDDWITASAPGLVVRSEYGVVMVDLDGDGHEQTGWDILYLHVATKDRIPVGTLLNINDHIGHPSCEGGDATGTHVHVARKYNGEWILAGGAIPFNLSGWVCQAGDQPYLGTMTNGDDVVTANVYGSHETQIKRGQ